MPDQLCRSMLMPLYRDGIPGLGQEHHTTRRRDPPGPDVDMNYAAVDTVDASLRDRNYPEKEIREAAEARKMVLDEMEAQIAKEDVDAGDVFDDAVALWGGDSRFEKHRAVESLAVHAEAKNKVLTPLLTQLLKWGLEERELRHDIWNELDAAVAARVPQPILLPGLSLRRRPLAGEVRLPS